MGDCNHEWEVRPKASDRGNTRYQCLRCGCWGRRAWRSRNRGIIQVYLVRGRPLLEAKPEWFEVLRGDRWYAGPEKLPRIRDAGLVETLAPSDEEWHDPR